MRGARIRIGAAAIGGLAVFVLGGVLAWTYRTEIAVLYRSIVGADRNGTPESAIGIPSPASLQSAERKESALADRDGPPHVVLTADEMASLIAGRLDPVARRALDSIRVILDDDRFTLEGQIRTDVFGRGLLGPLAGILDAYHPIRVSGAVELRASGLVAWSSDEFVIASFPFPPSAIPRLVNRLTGGTEGAFLIAVPETVGEVRVRSDGVTFYRRVE